MTPRRRRAEEELYGEVVGFHALSRQLREGSERFPCCGERRRSGHHILCPEYVEPKRKQEEALF